VQRLLFGLMYRFGFTPWEGHALPARLRALADEPATGRALDVGCGTGDASVFLARAGWDVTGVDFVERALRRARARAASAGANVRFVRADVTRLPDAALGEPFDLIVDNGCLHGLSDDARAAYVRSVTSVAAPGARLLLAAFPVGAQRKPRGIDRAEIEERFRDDWEMVVAETDPEITADNGEGIGIYELRRR
jgi:SAM-dependent methyltransferase